MPYKDKNKTKINLKKWKEENKEFYSIKQKKYQKNYRNKDYIDYINILTSLSKSDKIEYLSTFHVCTRSAIIRRLPENQQKEYKLLLETITKNRIKNRKQTGRNIIIQYKKTHPCEYCGENNYLKLSFHHINEKTKINPGKGMIEVATSRSIESLKTEIQKCIVLCHNCHHIFHNNNYKNNLLNNYNKLWEKQKTKREWNNMYKFKNNFLLFLYKETLVCNKCGEIDNRCFVSHHIDYKTKKNRISKLTTINSINIELSKCICLCKNCHEEYHQIYGNSFSNKKDLEKYLNFTPIPLLIDIGIYKEKFYKELSKFKEQTIKYDLGPIFS